MSKTPVASSVPPPLPASVRPTANSDPIFRRKVAMSRAALYFERLWPRIWLPLTVLGLFAVASLGGLWPHLSQLWHAVLLGAFGLGLFASLVPAIRLPWPTREEGVRRIEVSSDLPHRPASSYEDQLAPVAKDMAARRLWEAHRNRLKSMFGRMRVGNPTPRVDRRDPFALRALLALGVLLLLVLAGDRAYDRLTAPFRLGPTALSATARLDAWVSPPPYTGRPPMMLADGSRPIADILLDPNRRNEVPFGSQLVVRSSGEGHERFSVEIRTNSGEIKKIAPVGKDEKAEDKAKDDKSTATKSAPSTTVATPVSVKPVVADVTEFRAEIHESGTIRVLSGSREIVSWPFNVIPDLPPRIALTEPHEVTPRGALKLNYKAEDDYGVVSAEARFARVLSDEEKARAAARKGPRPPLERPPRFDLKLPKIGAKIVEGKAFQDLAAHPWAGMKVLMWLEARDQANQIGKSELVEMMFPSRKFRKPLARAVVEQRRELAADSFNRQRVIQALDLITYAPEKFMEDRAVYLGLRSVHWRLKHDKSRAAVRAAVDQLWHIALRIEDGNMSDIERRLRDAQDALSKALKDGADEKEIKRLTEELREAMNNYLDSLMRQAEQQGRLDQMPDRNGAERDLDQLLKDLEQMAKEGSKEQAQQLLSELQELLDQLQSGRFNQGENQQNGQMNQMLDRFGDIIKKQQGLLDDTFKEQRGPNGQQQRNQPNQRSQPNQQGPQSQPNQQGQRRQPGQNQQGQQRQPGQEPGPNTEKGENGPSDRQQLGQRQQLLRGQLDRLLRDLENFGVQTPDQFGEAGEAMEQAEEALKKGDLGKATEQQQLALEKLRQGGQQMAQQMMRNLQRRLGQRRAPMNTDPLGRPRPDQGLDPNLSLKVPDKIDAQRAREILEELRRRLSEQKRPPEELEYLERLLKRF